MATRLDVEIAQANLRCQAIQGAFEIRVERWQGVQTAGLASLALTYTGLFTKVLGAPIFVVLAFLGFFAVLFAVHMQEEALRDFQQELAQVNEELERLKRE